MPEPINATSAPLYTYSEEPAESELTCRSPASGAAPREASGGAPGQAPAATDSKDAPRSCLAPAVKAAATCGAIVVSQGVAALLAGAACMASVIELDDCLAARRHARSRE